MQYRQDMKEALKEAIRSFFDIQALADKALKEAAENYVYERDVSLSADISEKLEEGMENFFDEVVEEAIEEVLWD